MQRLLPSDIPIDRLIVIWLPLPHDNLHPNARAHWRSKAASTKLSREYAYLKAHAVRPPAPFREAVVSLDFYLKRKRDIDGLIAFCKSYFDGMQDAGIYVNDSNIELGWVRRHSWKDSPTKQPCVVFTVGELCKK